MTFGMYGLLFLASLDLQRQRGASALAAGLELLPLPVVFVVVSPFVAGVVTRIGPRLPMTAGMGLLGGGLLAFAALGGDTNLGALELVLALLGLGLALNTGPVPGSQSRPSSVTAPGSRPASRTSRGCSAQRSA
jgi:hypothetical protein